MPTVENSLTKLIENATGKHFKAFNDIDVKASLDGLDGLTCGCCLNRALIRKHPNTPFYIQFVKNKPKDINYITREYLNELLYYNDVNKSNEIHRFNEEEYTETITIDENVYTIHLLPIAIYENRIKRVDNTIIPFLTDELEEMLESKFYFVIYKIKYVKLSFYDLLGQLKGNDEPVVCVVSKKVNKKSKKSKKSKKNVGKKNENECDKSDKSDESDDVIETRDNVIEVADEVVETTASMVETTPSISPQMVETTATLNIVFDKFNTFQNTDYLTTVIYQIYNTNNKVKQYFDEYDVIYVIKDLHFDNYHYKRGNHFNIKLISNTKISPILHAYLNEGVINNITFIQSLTDD
jgi:hypothetical protein